MIASSARRAARQTNGVRSVVGVSFLLLAALLAVGPLVAQDPHEDTARRLASIVTVTVSEYGKAVDADGRIIAPSEYEEAVAFLTQARALAPGLSGPDATRARAVLDTLNAAAAARHAPAAFAAIAQRLTSALGAAGTLDLPTSPLNLAMGRGIYETRCISCHGGSGLGDGPAAKGMKPPPPAIGSAPAMVEVSPALLYRVLAVGIPGTQMPGWASTLTSRDRWEVVGYLQSLRATPSDVLEGEALFHDRCAGCDLKNVLSFRWQVERSDAQLDSLIRMGIPDAKMKINMPPARDLSAAQMAKVIAYLRSTAQQRIAPPDLALSDATVAAATSTILSLLGRSLSAAQGGHAREAADRAFDAYIAFEPLEAPVGAKDPQLVVAMERLFATFKGAINANDVPAAQAARDAIVAKLPSVVALTYHASTAWAAFFQSLLIILREGFEAILVIGAIAAFLIKTGNQNRLRAIWWGAGLGLVASAATAVVLQTALRAVPGSRDLIEGITMLVAVAVLFSVSYWLISKVEAAKWQKFIRDQVASALQHGGGKALALAAFLAVYREGAETALFYQALLGEGAGVFVPILLGIGVGFSLLAVIFTLFYRFGVRIPLRPFFAATSALLYAMAFVMMGRGLHELQEVNVLSVTRVPGVPQWDALGIFPTVETLFGQLVLVVLLSIAVTMTLWPKRAPAEP